MAKSFVSTSMQIASAGVQLGAGIGAAGATYAGAVFINRKIASFINPPIEVQTAPEAVLGFVGKDTLTNMPEGLKKGLMVAGAVAAAAGVGYVAYKRFKKTKAQDASVVTDAEVKSETTTEAK